MQKLDRTSCTSPACLATYRPGVHKWGNVTSADRTAINEELTRLQGTRCAYCDGGLDILGRHIEHFRPRSAFPELTFDWYNLLWSCDRRDSCGHFKDNGAGLYHIDDLINPCSEDPDRFFIFRADGTIGIRPGLPPKNQHRARETLRVLALDASSGRLRSMRAAAVSGFVTHATEAAELEFTPDEVRKLLADELQQARDLPFYTAIRHVLTERQE